MKTNNVRGRKIGGRSIAGPLSVADGFSALSAPYPRRNARTSAGGFPSGKLATAMVPKTIAEWPRNAREVIRVSLSAYNGQPVIDLRTWFRDGSGEMRPGRSGLTLGAKHLPKLVGAITKALAEAVANGIVPDEITHEASETRR